MHIKAIMMKKLFTLGLLIAALAILAVFTSSAQPVTSSSVVATCSNIQVNASLATSADVHVEAFLNTLGESNRLFSRRVYNNQSGTFSATINYDSTAPTGSTILYLINLFTPGTSVNLGAVTGSVNCSTVAAAVGPTPIPDSFIIWLNGGDVLVPIRVHCTRSRSVAIEVINNSVGVEAFRVTPEEITAGANLAQQLGANVQVGAGVNETGLWVLTSNELQATRRSGGALNYDFIFSIQACGPIAAPTITVAQPTATPVSTATPVATGTPAMTGTAVTPSLTLTPVVSTSGACVAPAGASAAYLVKRGDNLFRIGLRFGISYVELARFNGIANPARILEGQCIIIP